MTFTLSLNFLSLVFTVASSWHCCLWRAMDSVWRPEHIAPGDTNFVFRFSHLKCKNLGKMSQKFWSSVVSVTAWECMGCVGVACSCPSLRKWWERSCKCACVFSLVLTVWMAPKERCDVGHWKQNVFARRYLYTGKLLKTHLWD